MPKAVSDAFGLDVFFPGLINQLQGPEYIRDEVLFLSELIDPLVQEAATVVRLNGGNNSLIERLAHRGSVRRQKKQLDVPQNQIGAMRTEPVGVEED